MTRFDLDDAQHDLKELLRTALAADLTPARITAILDQHPDQHPDPDPTGWRRLADLGVLGLAAPAEYGGAGEGVLTLAVAAEELGYAAAPSPFLGQVLAVLALTEAGDADLGRRWLPGLVTGTVRAAVAPGAPAVAVAVTATGLTGTVPHVLGVVGADLVLVTTTDGLSAVPTDADGVTVEPVDGLDRTRRLGALSLVDAAHTPLPGGRALADRILDTARVLVAADAHGGARRCCDLALAHARTRVQFGAPIGAFQVVRHQLADLTARIEPGSGLYWLAAHRLDTRDARASGSAALAKAHLTEVYLAAARESVRLHGALGYTWDGPVHPWVRRAVLDNAIYGLPGDLLALVAGELGWG